MSGAFAATAVERDGARSPPPLARLPGLDVLRAWAIVWTMLYHASLFGLLPEDPWLVRFGWMGVDLFFVLSGYLIGGQLLREIHAGTADYGRFMARRLFRTVPAYAVVVLLYFTVPEARERDVLQPLWQFVTFTQNVGIVPPKALSHAWSLSVEEQFYVLAPPVLGFLAWRTRRAAWIAVALLVVGGMALRAATWLAVAADVPYDATGSVSGSRYMTWIYYPTWTRLDGLVAGVAMAALQVHRPELWTRLGARPNALLAAAVTGVVGSSLVFGGQIAGLVGATVGYPLLAWSLALGVVAGARADCVIAKWRIPAAGAIAASAYSVYLTHKAVFGAVARWGGGTPSASALALASLAVLGAVVAGAVLYLGVERPFLRLRDRLVRPRRRLAVEAIP